MPLYIGILVILVELMRKHLKVSALASDKAVFYWGLVNFVMHVPYLFWYFMKRRKSFNIVDVVAQSQEDKVELT